MSLIVGAGLTSAALYHYMQQKVWQSLSATGSLSLASAITSTSGGQGFEIWDRNDHIGGRMRNIYPSVPTLHDPYLRADMGAQYLSQKSSSPEIQEVYDYLLDKEVLVPLETLSCNSIEGVRSNHYEQRHFIAWKGTSEIVRALCPDQIVTLNRTLTHLDLSQDGKYWEARYSDVHHPALDMESASRKLYTNVILCVPPRCLLDIAGNWKTVIQQQSLGQNFLESLPSVTYSSRYAAAIFVPSKCREKMHQSIPWLAKYVDKDSIIRFVSLESRKLRRPPSNDNGECLLVHTTIPFGMEHQDSDSSIVKDLIWTALCKHIPELEDHRDDSVIDLVFWKDSQVANSLRNAKFESDSLVIRSSKDTTITFIGDAFTESNFEGCLRSAHDAARKLQEY